MPAAESPTRLAYRSAEPDAGRQPDRRIPMNYRHSLAVTAFALAAVTTGAVMAQGKGPVAPQPEK